MPRCQTHYVCVWLFLNIYVFGEAEWLEYNEVFDPASKTTVKVPMGDLCLIDGLTMDAFPLMTVDAILAKSRVNVQFQVEVECARNGCRGAILEMRKRKERVIRNEHEGVRIVRKVAFVTTEEFKLIYKKEPGSPGCSAPLVSFPSYSLSSGNWDGTFMELQDCIKHGINHLEVELYATVERHYQGKLLRPCGVVRAGQGEDVFKALCMGESGERHQLLQGVPGICARHEVLEAEKDVEQHGYALGNSISQGAAGLVQHIQKKSVSMFGKSSGSNFRMMGAPDKTNSKKGGGGARADSPSTPTTPTSRKRGGGGRGVGGGGRGGPVRLKWSTGVLGGSQASPVASEVKRAASVTADGKSSVKRISVEAEEATVAVILLGYSPGREVRKANLMIIICVFMYCLSPCHEPNPLCYI